MQEAFIRLRIAGYAEHIERVTSSIIANWSTNGARFLVHPAMTELTLDTASTVFIGHEPDTDSDLATKGKPSLYHYNTH